MSDSHAASPVGALFTDLYELTMLQAYFAEGMEGTAVFELFFRKMPAGRNFIVAAGLDDVLRYIEGLAFGADELAWLASLGRFSEAFLERLQDFRFSGEVYAVPEGTIVFENEPVLQVVAPLPEAQLIETYVLNQIHLQSVVASKASRLINAARPHRVVDFGSRRAHGTDAALKVARASYIAGAAGTSNVLASRRYGIPVFGTMAHSYIEAHNDERSAFKRFVEAFPQTTLLVDTYDTLAGVRHVIELACELGNRFQVAAIRLDSGALGELARTARGMLDAAGLSGVQIFASGGLNEARLAALVAEEAPIDGFGVGTELAVSTDAPELDFAYKLVEFEGRPRMKLSAGKVHPPARKQVFRTLRAGRMVDDVIGRFDEDLAGEALLQPVMRGGRCIDACSPSLSAMRVHAQQQLALLPDALKQLNGTAAYPVAFSESLNHASQQLEGLLKTNL